MRVVCVYLNLHRSRYGGRCPAGRAAGGDASVVRAGGTVLGRLSHGKGLVNVYH